MRYVVVLILFAIVAYGSTVAAALLIGRDSGWKIILSLLVGFVVGTFVIVLGLKGKIRG